MSRRGDSLKRRRPRIQPALRLLVVAEGEVTEAEYLRGLRHQERSQLVHIEVVGLGATPKTVVERAVQLSKEARQDARRERDDFLKYDEVWCVFDRDEHPLVPEAKQQAFDNEFHVAFSNPCFELWLLLHFQDQRAFIERDKTAHELSRHVPGYSKHVHFPTFAPLYEDAFRRARELVAWQERQGRAGENPWTTVHLLTDRVRQLGKAALLGQRLAAVEQMRGGI